MDPWHGGATVERKPCVGMRGSSAWAARTRLRQELPRAEGSELRRKGKVSSHSQSLFLVSYTLVPLDFFPRGDAWLLRLGGAHEIAPGVAARGRVGAVHEGEALFPLSIPLPCLLYSCPSRFLPGGRRMALDFFPRSRRMVGTNVQELDSFRAGTIWRTPYVRLVKRRRRPGFSAAWTPRRRLEDALKTMVKSEKCVVCRKLPQI